MPFEFIDKLSFGYFNFSNHSDSACQKFEKIIHLIIDREATASDKEYFKSHRAKCPECLDKFLLEREVKKLINQKIRKKHVPSDVIISILEKIGKAA